VDERNPTKPEDARVRRMEELARLIDALRRAQRRGEEEEQRRAARSLVEWFTSRGGAGPGSSAGE